MCHIASNLNSCSAQLIWASSLRLRSLTLADDAVQEAGSDRKLVVATDLVATLAQKLGAELTLLGPSFPGYWLYTSCHHHDAAGYSGFTSMAALLESRLICI